MSLCFCELMLSAMNLSCGLMICYLVTVDLLSGEEDMRHNHSIRIVRESTPKVMQLLKFLY